ncbi:TetR/AcrR family transcriptional regulator [Nocardia sp. NBC_00565]|nr:helix-turn-helix domain-containing protein [Nocardia sp. NBC_00565]WUC06777.1 TetR/AcrR family transcriptional regulator [Nocardia sp. NBC_00565]
MAQIAEEVGITAGALYRHFPNKAGLRGSPAGVSGGSGQEVERG